MSIAIPRGTQDFLPGTVERWQFVENRLTTIAKTYNFKEIRTPIFEHTELFQRGVGESTDIVQKEMYSFEDMGKRSLTLRPEGTASIARAFVTHKLHGNGDLPQKLYYNGPMFRYERPQSGRYRQFHQFGVEVLGALSADADAEVIALAFECYRTFGFKQLKVAINSLGDAESRKQHRDALVAHFQQDIGSMCEHCQSRLEQNPLRVLDCKVDAKHPLMASAPKTVDYLNEESALFFENVKKALDAMDIPYVVDPNLVRGLDYYNHTVFEIISESEGFGSQTTLCGGGRYNGLVEGIGGPETPAVGFALGMERFMLALDAEGIELPIEQQIDVFAIAMGDEANVALNGLLREWRAAGLVCERDFLNRKMKALWKQADRLGARNVVILGENELQDGVINIKNQATGEQQTVAFADALALLKG
ncbi:MAG: histidine--tRNA ligase [Bacilli bacterium]